MYYLTSISKKNYRATKNSLEKINLQAISLLLLCSMPLCFWARFPVNEFCWESDLVSASFIIIQQVFHDLDAGPAHLLGFNMYTGQSQVGKFCRGRVVKGNQTDLFWDFDPGFFKGLQGTDGHGIIGRDQGFREGSGLKCIFNGFIARLRGKVSNIKRSGEYCW